MATLLRQRRFRILAAAVSAALFYFSLGLNPLWIAAWFAPVPILLATFYSEDWREAALLSYLAVGVGLSTNFTYYLKATGVIVTPILLLLQILAWGLFFLRARHAVRASNSWLTVFVYPILQTGTGTLVGLFSPHGTWGSYAYTQMDALPVIQIASLMGSAAVVFLLGLFASTLAVALYRGVAIKRPALAYGLPLALLALGLGYGFWRLQVAPQGPTVRIGLASVDDFIGRKTAAKDVDAIWAAYTESVDKLARDNVRIVVLPEKIVALSSDAAVRQAYFSKLAARDSLYLVVGVQLNHQHEKANALWLFGPGGNLLAEYHKQHLVPALESDLKPGKENMVRQIDGNKYGLAICRDLLFSNFGRDYGNLAISALLVPAWDFYVDAWMESSVADMRAVEGGYSVVRAGRESYLNVSDRYGHLVARERSDFLPGTILEVELPLGPGRPTAFARFGNWFGILMAVAMAVILLSSFSLPLRLWIIRQAKD